MFDGMTQNYGFNGQGGFNQFNGFTPQQAQPIKNALTDEDIRELMQNGSNFSLAITETEAKRAKCTHRQIGGMKDSLVFDPVTGLARCTICGYEFQPIDADTNIDDIIGSVHRIIDILQTIKIFFPTLPASAVGEYFQIIPLLEKIPEFFKLAVKEFAKGDVNAWSYSNSNMGGAAMFANLMSAFGNGGFAPQQPVYGQQPFMNQPVGQPFVAPNPVQGNAFGYPGASQQPQGYTPMTPNGYAFQPGQQPAPAAPTVAAPATPAAPVDSTAVDVVSTTVNA